MNNIPVIAICGVKNSGKTTVISSILPYLTAHGLKVATIKHDGHDFDPDVPQTDSYKHRSSGAYGTAVISNNRFMLTKEASVTEKDLIAMFPEADLIILEGFKNSDYPKIEVVRSSVSCNTVSTGGNLVSLISDIPNIESGTPVFYIDDYKNIADFILNLFNLK